MSTKYELPLLTVSKPTQHWAIKALWMAGGVLGVQMVLVGAFVWQRHSAAEARTAAAQEAAPAPAPAAQPKAAATEKVALANTAPSAAVEAPTPAAEPATKPTVAARSHHRASSKHGASGGRLIAARAASQGAAVARPSAPKGPDPIDDLLKKFK